MLLFRIRDSRKKNVQLGFVRNSIYPWIKYARQIQVRGIVKKGCIKSTFLRRFLEIQLKENHTPNKLENTHTKDKGKSIASLALCTDELMKGHTDNA